MPKATKSDEQSSMSAALAKDTKGPDGAPDSEVTIQMQRYIELVEVDLWSRFQKRLWAVITGFLVLVSVAGFLGIPYYIESQTNAIFSSQSKKYEEEIRRITSSVKSFLLLSSKFEVFHQRLRQDIYVVLHDLAEYYEDNPKVSGFFKPDALLLKVLHEDDPRDLIDQRTIFIHRYKKEEFEKLKVSINETIHLENTIFGATGSTFARHPYRNGTLEGFIDDVKLKILILAAFKDALEAQRIEIFQIGGETSLEKRIRGLEVEAISNAGFLTRFDKYLSNNSDKLIFADSDSAEFQDVLKLYIEVLNFDPAQLPSIGDLKLLPKKEKIDPRTQLNDP